MNGMFKLSLSDWQKAAVMAIITGAALPIIAAVQTPNFSIVTVNWESIAVLAINGAILGGVSYLVKNFFSASDGSFAGIIGKPKQ